MDIRRLFSLVMSVPQPKEYKNKEKRVLTHINSPDSCACTQV
jgi:hypothetical protein